MTKIFAAAARYPWVVATLGVAIAGGILAAGPASGLVPWLVSGFALLVAAWQVVGMLRDLFAGHAGIDILAIIAICAAVAVGEYWAALVVCLMLTGGEALEDYAEQRSRRELTALLDRAPDTAHVLVSATETRTTPIDEVRAGDRILVRPGELVPIDATLVDAAAHFDESSIAGESLPVERVTGEKVPSGAVNGAVAVEMIAAATAADSQYQRIVQLVAEAGENKSRVIRLADRYAIPFTAIALGIAGIAWWLSGDAHRFAEVLVVATPCPLLIAAPVAFLGGMSRSARAGIIVKGSQTLEQLARVRFVAFDKTGTLTEGKPALTKILPVGELTEHELLRLAASAEVYSSHVLAASVVEAAKAAGLGILPTTDAEEEATNGVFARVAGREVRVGKAAWIAEHAPGFVPAEIAPGELGIHVSVDGRPAGTIVMRDRVRPSAAEAVAQLRELGVGTQIMVTGDVRATAAPIAEGLGLDRLYAECLPEDKVRIIREAKPRPVLMVGDGLNDAPVLAAADVGFAMGARGATAASESADVVNLVDEVSRVGLAVRYGQETVRIALQAIWMGMVISVGLMLVAAFGFLPAIVGAWLQEVVDLVAILWALKALGPRGERGPSGATRAGAPLATAAPR